MNIDAKSCHYKELNEQVRAALRNGSEEVRLQNVNGQRYIAAGLRGTSRLIVEGVPGNDLAAFMDGPTVVVHGNAQDGVGNTMNSGRVVVHGDAGDVIGYAMRGGRIYVKGDVGYRVGIHMKAYKEQTPAVIVGGTAQDFFGEYMAGGVLVLLGLPELSHRPHRNGRASVGAFCGTGLHGGAIYLRDMDDETRLAQEHVASKDLGEDDWDLLKRELSPFCEAFELDLGQVIEGAPFQKLAPISHRPFAGNYAANV